MYETKDGGVQWQKVESVPKGGYSISIFTSATETILAATETRLVRFKGRDMEQIQIINERHMVKTPFSRHYKKTLGGKLASVLYRRRFFQFPLWPFSVVKTDIFFDFVLCFGNCSDMIRIESFRFEMREETLHRGIVITISSARHADSGANLWQHAL
ncbi:hypothetical protein QP794_24145 [Paenibacillus sp. UMB7766-LJ446]|nr:hypothetical protein [Paenibacillus sp. UMB7766-LJ446]MDK8193183.1 hypothetical protein [Paenibacillus sp. UMB7766-LJ446]